MLPARRRQLRAWSHETGKKTPVAAERVNVNNTTALIHTPYTNACEHLSTVFICTPVQCPW